MHVWMLSHFSCVQLCVTPWTVAHPVLLSMGFSRQEYWSGLPCPLPGDLPNPGIEPRSPVLQVDSLPAEPPGKPSVNKGQMKNSLLNFGDWKSMIMWWRWSELRWLLCCRKQGDIKKYDERKIRLDLNFRKIIGDSMEYGLEWYETGRREASWIQSQ